MIRRSNEICAGKRGPGTVRLFGESRSSGTAETGCIYSQMLDRKYGPKLEPKALEYLGFCVEGAHRMERLITDLLAYSQAGKSVEEPLLWSMSIK